MSRRSFLVRYWNPLLFAFGTLSYLGFMVSELVDPAKVPGFVSAISWLPGLIGVIGLLVWFFCFFFVSWSVALVHAGYGTWAYWKTGDRTQLSFCVSALAVAGIYLLIFTLAHFGLYLDE